VSDPVGRHARADDHVDRKGIGPLDEALVILGWRDGARGSGDGHDQKKRC
jgi:hypothetical protein